MPSKVGRQQRFSSTKALSGLAAGLFALGAGAASADEQVACHLTYGGENTVHYAAPVSTPYDVAPIQVGSYFLFRVVFEKEPAALAAIKIYTYADQEDGPRLIQQSTYPYPPALPGNTPFGFTGQQAVYEPLRDGELQYWCAWQPPGQEGAR